MINQGLKEKISMPYAEALLELGSNHNLTAEIKQDLSLISATLKNSKKLELFLVNPIIVTSKKKEILSKLFADKVNSLILKFLLVLVERRRINLINTIISKYLILTYKLESIVVAELFTAVELSEHQHKNIANKIKFITKSTNVNLVTNVNPDLIGGFVVKIGSKIIDTSLAGKLKQMAFYLNA
uniref:ATP synthase subunit delta, chloroplastic n=1 Tax=Platysiphonia delicata TaxID=2006979 RepID=A0A1Z1M0G5_9FLOR|nr:ATP synthase CF1 subunit delta [Platysiphonia delicata]ARW59577.1 ATP synthase CF1 subunit delta [Platysiphonia delicata]